MTITEFEDPFSREVWETNYKYHEDVTVDDTLRRVAKAVASVEKEDIRQEWEDKFFDMLSQFKVTAGGRIYSNMGTGWGGATGINCFIGPKYDNDIDSIEGIFKVLLDQTLTLKSEGGWGYNFSWLRPRGSMIHGIGVETPGAVKYMELFDKSSEVITSGSGINTSHVKAKGKIRKGAMMGVMDVWHPDIIEFITAKQQPGRLSKFNISVNATDEFMEKVLEVQSLRNAKKSQEVIDEITWTLQFPDTTFEKYKTEWNGDLSTWKEKDYPVIDYRTVSVDWLWNLIMESTYNRAEPGVIFMDRANKYRPLNYVSKARASNPCVTGDTWVMTDNGPKLVKDLVDKPFNALVDGVSFETGPDGFFSTGVKPVYRLETTEGYEVKITEDHPLYAYDLGWTEVKDLEVGQKIRIHNHGEGEYSANINKTEWYVEVKSIEYSGEQEVFDVSVPDINVFDANGFYAHNCGEQIMDFAEACDLSSLNLTEMINDDGSDMDYEKIGKYVAIAIRFLDNINDVSHTPLPQYKKYMDSRRRIGLGILGWGSTLYMLGIRFGSEEAGILRDKIMKTITHEGVKASIDLAKEKGMFSECDPVKHSQSEYWDMIGLSDDLKSEIAKHGIRNSSLFSIQPTGNSSIFANILSGGLEPIFMKSYIRTVIVNKVPEHIESVCPKWWEGEFKETSMFKFTKEGDEEILRGKDKNGTVYKIDKNRGLTKEVLCEDRGVRYLKDKGRWDENADYVVTTENLTTDDHVNDLIGFSKWLDSACSKTINVPHNYPFDKFKNVYLDAYSSGVVKGVTTYRAGTMANVLSAKEEMGDDTDEEIIKEDVKIPASAPASMKILKAEGRKWYLTVVLNETGDRPFAFFVHTNSYEKGVTTSDAVDRLLKLARKKNIPKKHIDSVITKMEYDNNSSKLARTISFLLRHGVLIKNVIQELNKMDDIPLNSFLFQIKKYLSQYIKDGTTVDDAECENCGSDKVVFSEGCFKCNDCGSSKCG